MATPVKSQKIKIVNYVFDKTAKTVTFSDYASILLDSILCVINVTKGIVIYAPNGPTLGGTVGTNILTLTYDTSAMANTDKLLIYYDDPTITTPVSGTVSSNVSGTRKDDGTDLAANQYHVTVGGSDGTHLFPLSVDANGKLNVKISNVDPIIGSTPKQITVAYIASQTGATVLTPTAGKKIVITDYVISPTGAGTLYLFDNTDTATSKITPILNLNSIGGIAKGIKNPVISSAIDNVIKYTSGAGAAGSIWINYYEI
jgi:hypothetical protein